MDSLSNKVGHIPLVCSPIILKNQSIIDEYMLSQFGLICRMETTIKIKKIKNSYRGDTKCYKDVVVTDAGKFPGILLHNQVSVTAGVGNLFE